MRQPSVPRKRAGRSGGAWGRSPRPSAGSISPGWTSRPTPSSFRRLLQRVEDDPRENIPEEGLVAACDQALRKFEQAAGLAVNRIRGVVDARREVEAGAWNDAAVGRIRTVLRRLEDAHQVLDGDTCRPAR